MQRLSHFPRFGKEPKSDMAPQNGRWSGMLRPAFISTTTIRSPSSFRTTLVCNRTTPKATISLSSLRVKIPMALTYARVAAIPLLCVTGLANPPQQVLTTALFAVASFTDFLDGYLARKWSVVSPMGTFLDPVADKLMVTVALTLITARLQHPLVILSTAVIVSREIFVSALREWMAILGKSADVKVSVWGKLKTTTQMVAVTLLLLVSSLNTWYAYLGLVLLVFAATLSVFSASDYVLSAARALKQP